MLLSKIDRKSPYLYNSARSISWGVGLITNFISSTLSFRIIVVRNAGLRWEDKQPKNSLSNPTGRILPNLDGGERKEGRKKPLFFKDLRKKVLIKDGSGPEMKLFRKTSIHQSSKTLNLHPIPPIPLSKNSVCLVVLRHRIPFSSRIR